MHCGVGSRAPPCGPAHSLHGHVHLFRPRNVRLFSSCTESSRRSVFVFISSKEGTQARSCLVQSLGERRALQPPCVVPLLPSFPLPPPPSPTLLGLGEGLAVSDGVHLIAQSAPYHAESGLPLVHPVNVAVFISGGLLHIPSIHYVVIAHIILPCFLFQLSL